MAGTVWHTLAMMRVTALFFTLIIVGISGLSMGQQAELPQGQISASEILRKNLIATGGLQAHKGLETLVASGDFRLNTTRMGDYKFSYKGPGNDMLEIRRISHGGIWTGHHGHQAVNRATSEVLGAPEPGELCIWCVINGVDTWIVEHDWLRLMQWDFCCAYERIELIGIGEVDKRPAYGLRFTPKKGGIPFLCFYDRETFLLVRIDQIQRSRTSRNRAETVSKVESIFRDYRVQGGVKLPFVIAIPRPEGDVVFEMSKIKTNEAVKDSVFQ